MEDYLTADYVFRGTLEQRKVVFEPTTKELCVQCTYSGTVFYKYGKGNVVNKGMPFCNFFYAFDQKIYSDDYIFSTATQQMLESGKNSYYLLSERSFFEPGQKKIVFARYVEGNPGALMIISSYELNDKTMELLESAVGAKLGAKKQPLNKIKF